MPQRRHRDVDTEKLSRLFYQSLNCILKTSPCLSFPEQFDPMVSSFLAGREISRQPALRDILGSIEYSVY